MLVLMMIGLLFLAPHLAPSLGWVTFLEIIIVVVGYGLIMGWLKTHPNLLAPQSPAEVDDRAVKSPQVELLSAGPPQVRYEFYVGSDPALIYGRPEASNGHLRSNGHHLADPSPSRPEEAAE